MVDKIITVLLAEDHAVVRESIRQILDREPNIEVIDEAGTGREAIEMARKDNPDVILMDISMPELNGIEATREIKTFQPEAKILILTAYDYEQYIFPLLEAGAAGYLLKDITSKELISAINTVHKGDVVLHPAIANKVMWRFQKAKDEYSEKAAKNLLAEDEVAVLKMAAKGLNNSSIADELHLSTQSIEDQLNSIFSKLGVGSRTEAIIHAIKKGWLTVDDLS